MSFLTGTQAELLFAAPAAITKNTYTTEAAYTGVVGTNEVCAIPPGFFLANPNPVGRSLCLKVFGTIANTAAATFAVNLGLDVTPGTKANAVAIHSAMTPTAAITAPWDIEAYITCTAFATSTMSLQVNGVARYQSAAAGGTPNATAQSVGFGALLTGLDPRVQFYLELFGTWSASSASNTTTVQQEFLFGLN